MVSLFFGIVNVSYNFKGNFGRIRGIWRGVRLEEVGVEGIVFYLFMRMIICVIEKI